MHKGRPWPWLREYWAGNYWFWPNRAPMRVSLRRRSATTIDDWDYLPITSPGDISEVGLWNATLGELDYFYADPGGLYEWRLRFTNCFAPGSTYNVDFRLHPLTAGGVGVLNQDFAFNFFMDENVTYFPVVAVIPPFVSNTPLVDLELRPATWQEI